MLNASLNRRVSTKHSNPLRLTTVTVIPISQTIQPRVFPRKDDVSFELRSVLLDIKALLVSEVKSSIDFL